MKSIKITLPEAMKGWVQSTARARKFESSSAYVRDLIRQDWEREEALADKRAKEAAWLRDNKAAIDAHNERIDREGTLIKPMGLRD